MEIIKTNCWLKPTPLKINANRQIRIISPILLGQNFKKISKTCFKPPSRTCMKVRSSTEYPHFSSAPRPLRIPHLALCTMHPLERIVIIQGTGYCQLARPDGTCQAWCVMAPEKSTNLPLWPYGWSTYPTCNPEIAGLMIRAYENPLVFLNKAGYKTLITLGVG